MKDRYFGYAFAMLVVAGMTPLAQADDTSDFYFQQVIERYFEYPQNARTFGMAGSSVMTSTDSSSIVGNPAGLGFMRGGEFSGSYGYSRTSGTEFPTGENVTAVRNAGSGMLALPLGPTLGALPQFGNLGVAWSEADGRWDNDSFDTLSRRDQIVVSYAYAINENVSVGYGVGWTRDKFQSKDIVNYPMGDGFKHTLGVSWQPVERWAFGATSFVGYGKHSALYVPGTDGDSRTTEYGSSVGAQYRFDVMTVAFGGDYRHLHSDGDVESSIPANVVGGDENGNIFNIRAGVEVPFADWFLLRGGYRFAGLATYKYNRSELNDLNGSAYYHAWTLGAGFIIPLSSDYFPELHVDYGIEYRDVARDGWEHLVTLSVPIEFCRQS